MKLKRTNIVHDAASQVRPLFDLSHFDRWAEGAVCLTSLKDCRGSEPLNCGSHVTADRPGFYELFKTPQQHISSEYGTMRCHTADNLPSMTFLLGGRF